LFLCPAGESIVLVIGPEVLAVLRALKEAEQLGTFEESSEGFLSALSPLATRIGSLGQQQQTKPVLHTEHVEEANITKLQEVEEIQAEVQSSTTEAAPDRLDSTETPQPQDEPADLTTSQPQDVPATEAATAEAGNLTNPNLHLVFPSTFSGPPEVQIFPQIIPEAAAGVQDLLLTKAESASGDDSPKVSNIKFAQLFFAQVQCLEPEL
jgi:hypothetical protein